METFQLVYVLLKSGSQSLAPMTPRVMNCFAMSPNIKQGKRVHSLSIAAMDVKFWLLF